LRLWGHAHCAQRSRPSSWCSLQRAGSAFSQSRSNRSNPSSAAPPLLQRSPEDRINVADPRTTGNIGRKGKPDPRRRHPAPAGTRRAAYRARALPALRAACAPERTTRGWRRNGPSASRCATRHQWSWAARCVGDPLRAVAKVAWNGDSLRRTGRGAARTERRRIGAPVAMAQAVDAEFLSQKVAPALRSPKN
jgi:hypothetical protein